MGFIEFLALTWWIWLVGAVACYSCVAVMFMRKAKRDEKLGFNERFNKFFEGFLVMMLVAALGAVFFIMFLLGFIPAYAQALIEMIF